MGRLFYTKKSVVIRGRKFCYKLTVYSWLIPVTSNFSLLHFTRELRLMDVLDSLCQRTKLYQARAGPDFPYLKGGMRICCCFLKDKGTTYHYLNCKWESGRKKNYHPCCLNLILLRLTDERFKSTSELIVTSYYSPFLLLISAKSQLLEVMDN